MKRLLTLVLLFTVCIAMAQNRQEGPNGRNINPDTTKHAKSIKAIVDSYDQVALKDLYATNLAKEQAEKQDALAYAMVRNIPVKRYNADGSFDELQKIAEDGTPIYYTLHNVNAAISTRANFLNTGGGLGLTVDGNGMTAHVWDGGPTRPTHEAFDGPGGTNRVTINDGNTTLDGNSFHAQHVTGTIMASGLPDASSKGMSWQANALTHDWNSDLSEATTEAGMGMLLSNHSYGYNASAIPDAWFGQYGSDARDWDLLMYASPYYLQIKSAGNDGNDNSSNASPLDGQSAYDKLNGDACAKNNLVIANGQDASVNATTGALISVNRNSGSSEGPTDDYRIKPDIMANGTSLRSTLETSNSAYGNLTGTSMSAPNTTGTLLLLQEHYNDINGSFMKAATLKGLALHTADDVSPAGPDAQTGWGQLNAKFAAETITAAPTSAVVSELNLSNGATYQVTIQSDGVNPLMASISWTDPAGTVNSGLNSNTPALVNDLDLRLNNGSTFTPWRLTGVTTNGTGDNTVDPFERIDISGASGQYTLTVTHKGSLTNGSQDFSLIVTGGTIAASTPEISYGTTTTLTTEGTDCNFTDVTVPLNIAMAPSQNADVTFAVNGGTAGNNLDYEIVTPSLTFLQGQTASHNLVVRVYHDGVVESSETAIIDFTVNPNGGDASANPAADSLTLTINDDDSAPTATQNVTVLYEDFEDATGWTVVDADGDGNNWGIRTDLGGTHGYVGAIAFSYSWNGSAFTPNNYLRSPQFTIPANATVASVSYEIGSGTDPNFFAEHYSVYFTDDISTEAAMIGHTVLENDRTIPAVGSETRTHNLISLAGQTGYLVFRHHNVTNQWYLGLDSIDLTATINTNVQTAVNTGTQDQIDIPGMGTLHTADAVSGDVMLDITNNNSFDYGCTSISVSRSGTGAQSYNGSTSPDLVTDKTFDITPTNTTGSGNTSITFYFTEAEVAGWESATGDVRSNLVAARGNATTVTETSSLTVGSFGSHVTLTGTFTGLDGTYYFGPLGAFVACTGVTKTWDGTNWTPMGAPGATDFVVINGNYTTATHGNLNACTLTISNSSTLTVSASGFVNVDGDITVNTGATLEVEHTGSVVQVDPDALATNSGTINVHLTTPPLKSRDFMLMGSPMTAETRDGVFTSSYNVQHHTPANFLPHPSVTAGGTNFMDDNLDDWNGYNVGSNVITPGEGFLVYPQAAYNDPAYAGPPPVTTIQFPLTYSQGTLNTGDIDRTIVFNNLVDNPDGTPNFLSNPYASPIDASTLVANNALINELYFWEHLTPPSAGIPGANTINVSMDDLSIYNGTMGIPAANDPGTSTAPNGVISTGQGFGIKAFGGGTVTFTNAMRLTSGNTTLRSPEGLEKLLLKVESAQFQVRSYAGIGFRQDATPQLDEGMDTNRLATLISLYSHLEDGSEQLGIQSRETFESGIKIPMGFTSQILEDSTYKISLVDVTGTNLLGSNIYLVDHLTGMITDLTQSDYEFRSDTGTFDARFTLQFETEVLGTGDLALNSISLYPNPADALLNVISPNAEITGITIHDVQGRKIEELTINNERSYQVDISSLDTALYFVTVTTESGSVTKRIVKK